MSDLIDRQAAIDAIDVLCQEHRYKIPGKRETYSQYNETWQDALDRAEVAIFNLPPAQPEKRTGERTETHACDSISRQAAIDICTSAIDLWSGQLGEGALVAVRNKIAELPSALGMNLAEVGMDCISRQALLDKFEPWLKVKDYNNGELNMLKAVLYEIRFMPPAQPKRGKWHYSNGKPATIGRSFGVICDQCGTESEYCTNFCGECGADMRG